MREQDQPKPHKFLPQNDSDILIVTQVMTYIYWGNAGGDLFIKTWISHEFQAAIT